MGCSGEQDQFDLKPVCSLCGSTGIQEFRTLSDEVLYRRCVKCSTISRHPDFRLTPEEERARYLLHNNSPSNKGYVRWIQRFHDFIFRLPLEPGSRILDFGSGPEAVMSGMMEDMGYQVFQEDPYFAPGKPEGLFSLITSLEVFEHLSEPFQILLSLAGRSAGNGRLCISTEFLPPDFSPDTFDSWYYRRDSSHIMFYTRQGLVDAAVEAGFTEEYSDGVRYLSLRLAHPGTSC